RPRYRIAMKVAVIGAGASGLSTIKSCLDEGLEVECFEQGHGVGGLWRYSDSEGHSSVYASTVINTSKELSCFSDFPIPKDFAPFLPHYKLLQYYELYSQQFGLSKYVHFECKVVSVRRQKQDELDTSKWEVMYQCNGALNGEHCRVFDAVFVCTGHLWQPRFVDYPGLSQFKGRILHSHSYKNQKDFENKTVLVIGLGNSAADIAVDLSRSAKQVYISTRSGALLNSRLVAGIPFDCLLYSRAFNSMPGWLGQLLINRFVLHQLNYQHYGLHITGDKSKAPIVTNDELIIRISTGTVRVKTEIAHFDERSAVFVDHSEIRDLDVVLLCTGYTIGFEFLDKEIISPPLNNDLGLYKYVFPPRHSPPTLAFIGFVTIKGSMNPTVEMQARWAIRVVKGTIQLPSQEEMMNDINQGRQQLLKGVHDRPQNTLLANGITYNDSLADQIGCRPKILRMIFKDPVLALHCFFGPCHPAQYRLRGPGMWPGARQAIMNSYLNRVYSTMTRTVPPCQAKRDGLNYCIYRIVISLFVLFVMLSWLLLT
ncbi:hypothetical protein QZH41_014331, partial [Actinostola sp. cb2023]